MINKRYFSALHTFSVVAKYLSFTKAAEELCITQGAVSQQIAQLESNVGFPLFERQGRALALTEEAKRLLPVVETAIDNVCNVIEKLNTSQQVIKLSVFASFANKWLIPKLPQFQLLHPNINIQIIEDNQVININKSDIDLAIRFGQGPYTNCRSTMLCKESMQPICSPAYLNSLNQELTINNLSKQNIIHNIGFDGSPYSRWQQWLDAHAPSQTLDQGIVVTNPTTAQQLALNDQGIALGRTLLIKEDIESGLLVCPFEKTVTLEQSYYSIRPNKDQSSEVDIFESWLIKTINSQINSQ